MSKDIKKQGTKTIRAIAKGKRSSQQKVANWSNLNLGSVALNQTKTKQKKQVFTPKIIDWMFIILLFSNSSGRL